MLPNPQPYLCALNDPRRHTRNKLHALPDIVMITLCATLCGYDDWVSIEARTSPTRTSSSCASSSRSTTASLRSDVELWLDSQAETLPTVETVDKGHGRVETRRYCLSSDIGWLEGREQWKGLSAVGRVETTQHIGEQVTLERRYFLCSFADLAQFSQVVRDHWAIENQQHWVLDVQFQEDGNRSRKDHSSSNLALIRRACLNLLRRNDDSKLSIGRRRMRACTNPRYRSQLLFGGERVAL